jgi:hypothetical protein
MCIHAREILNWCAQSDTISHLRVLALLLVRVIVAVITRRARRLDNHREGALENVGDEIVRGHLFWFDLCA